MESAVCSPLYRFPRRFTLAGRCLRYPHIGWTDKLRAMRALLRIRRERRHDRHELESRSFRDWLEEEGQSGRAIRNLWDLLVLPALNDASENVQRQRRVSCCFKDRPA